MRYWLILLLLPLNVFSQNIFKTSKGTISFRSDAALELIKASSNKLSGALDVKNKTFAVTVTVNSFEGFNSPLQREHFNENYLESSIYKTAAFKGKIIEDVDFSKDQKITVRAKGKLNVHGVEQERIIKCTLSINNGVIGVMSAFTILLSDHNIKVPKVVHEKVASTIDVVINMELKK